jgi:hypothetical protein
MQQMMIIMFNRLCLILYEDKRQGSGLMQLLIKSISVFLIFISDITSMESLVQQRTLIIE